MFLVLSIFGCSSTTKDLIQLGQFGQGGKGTIEIWGVAMKEAPETDKYNCSENFRGITIENPHNRKIDLSELMFAVNLSQYPDGKWEGRKATKLIVR
jgi:hypothetical protein